MNEGGEVRLYRLAMALDVPSGEILERCAREGVKLRNHMAWIDPGMAERIRRWFDEDGGAKGSTSENG